MLHQVLHSGLAVADHGLAGGFDETRVAISGTRHGLRQSILWWLGYASEESLHQNIHHREQSLLASHGATDVTFQAVYCGGHALLGVALRFLTLAEYLPNRVSDQRAGSGISAALHAGPELFFLVACESDRDLFRRLRFRHSTSPLSERGRRVLLRTEVPES